MSNRRKERLHTSHDGGLTLQRLSAKTYGRRILHSWVKISRIIKYKGGKKSLFLIIIQGKYKWPRSLESPLPTHSAHAKPSTASPHLVMPHHLPHPPILSTSPTCHSEARTKPPGTLYPSPSRPTLTCPSGGHVHKNTKALWYFIFYLIFFFFFT